MVHLTMDMGKLELNVYAKNLSDGRELLYEEYQALTASHGQGTAPKGMHIEKDSSLEDYYGFRVVRIKSLPHVEVY